MTCTSEKIIIAEVSRHTSDHVNVINIFYDITSILHRAHGILGVLLKTINVFCGENLALFTVISIHNTRKEILKKLRNKMKPKMERNTKSQGSKRSRDREIKFINKEL